MEGVFFRGCNFEDFVGIRVNLEGMKIVGV